MSLAPTERLNGFIKWAIQNDGKVDEPELVAAFVLGADANSRLQPEALKSLTDLYKRGISVFESEFVQGNLLARLAEFGVPVPELLPPVTVGSLREFSVLSAEQKRRALYPNYVEGWSRSNLDLARGYQTETIRLKEELAGDLRARGLAAYFDFVKEIPGRGATVVAVRKDGETYGYQFIASGREWEAVAAFDNEFRPMARTTHTS